MDRVNIVALSPSDKDNRKALTSFYRQLKDSDENLPISCEENIDVEIYSDTWLRGVLGNGPIYTTSFKMVGKKSSFNLGWSLVTLDTPPDSGSLGEVMSACNLLLVFVPCKAFLASGNLPSKLKKVTALLNSAPQVPVRFVFLESREVDQDTMTDILSKFGFTSRYRTRGTAYTCAADTSDFAKDLIADAIDVLRANKSANLNLMSIRRKLRKT